MASAARVRSLSLCSCSPRPFQREWLADLVGVPGDEVVVPTHVGGINHCTGILSLQLRDGSDAIAIVRRRTDVSEVVTWAIDTFGMIPYCWEHWTEFFPQLQRPEAPYKGRAQGLPMRYGRRIYDMGDQLRRVRSWEDIARHWAAEGGEHRIADLPHGPEDDGIIVVELMEAILEDRQTPFVVNAMNRGLIENLPAGCAVEVPALVNGEGVHPIGIGQLPTGLAAVLARHAMVQELTAHAALSGDVGLLRQAMTADPLLDSTLEPRGIDALMREMLAANERYLPHFAALD
jgi:alpha-galactosidase